MSIAQMNKKLCIKNHPHPKLSIKNNIKVEYVQIAYDDRYIIVNQRTATMYGTKWEETAKISDPYIGKILVEALVNDMKDKQDQQLVKNDLIKFWNDVKKYDEVLDSDNNE